MQKYTQLNKKPVISIVTGVNLGRVSDVVFDDDLHVVSLIVGVFSFVEIPINKVISVREDAILVEWSNSV